MIHQVNSSCIPDYRVPIPLRGDTTTQNSRENANFPYEIIFLHNLTELQ